MQDLIKAIHDSIINLRSNSKVTIKSVVAELKTLGLDCSEWDSLKSKEAFCNALKDCASEINDATAETELDALKAEINLTIAEAGSTSFKLGNLLNKAREACENQQEFLDWVDSNFGIKKAWAFRLMKVSQVFKGSPWNTVAVSALYTLQQQATDEQMAEARKFAEAGKLDINTVKSLLNPPVAQVITKPAVKLEEVEKKVNESVQEALMDTKPQDVQARIVTTEQPKPEVQQSTTVDNSGLQQRIEELLEANAKLTSQLAELTKPRLQQSNMPMLPQFNSSCMYARLGISQEDAADKGKILEAFKALCRAGYGRTHEAYPLMDEARHELCQQFQEVAA